MSHTESRRAHRLPATHIGGSISRHPMQLTDLSDIGARIRTSAWLAPGRDYVLRIDDPPFELAGRVVWARFAGFGAEGSAQTVFEAGLELVETSSEARHQLTRLMVRLAAQAAREELPEVRLAAR